MDDYRFAGFRIVGFPEASRTALREVAERLLPHEPEILKRWMERQFSTWEPPGIERGSLTAMFAGILNVLLHGLRDGTPEECIPKLEDAGACLAKSSFPYEALLISLHFLEESYMPFLLDPRPANGQEWLIRIDEFLHVAMGAMANAYFQAHRDELLASAHVGRVIQEALSPQIPRRAGCLEIGHVSVSATEQSRLGGDFLDVFSLDDGKTAFVIGDLAGHGLEAVADALMIRTLYKGLMRESHDAVTALGRLNTILRAELDTEHFATALAGILEGDGRVTLVNAGAPAPLILNGAGLTPGRAGVPLAVDAVPSYAAETVELADAGVLVAYTDGLPDSRYHGDFFGEERVKDAVTAMRDASARAIAEHLLDRALYHARGHIRDDISVVVLKRRG